MTVCRIRSSFVMWTGILAMVLAGCAGSHETAAPAVPSQALEFSTPSGEPLDVAARSDEAVVLYFWATWCGPCERSMPELQTLHEQYKDDDDVMVVAVNIADPRSKETRDAVRSYVEREGYTFPVGYDEDQLSEKVYGVRAIPTLLVLDDSNTVREAIAGVKAWQFDQVREKIETLKTEAAQNDTASVAASTTL
jgi:cytochrome c-type biogenesis protein